MSLTQVASFCHQSYEEMKRKNEEMARENDELKSLLTASHMKMVFQRESHHRSKRFNLDEADRSKRFALEEAEFNDAQNEKMVEHQL